MISSDQCPANGFRIKYSLFPYNQKVVESFKIWKKKKTVKLVERFFSTIIGQSLLFNTEEYNTRERQIENRSVLRQGTFISAHENKDLKDSYTRIISVAYIQCILQTQ